MAAFNFCASVKSLDSFCEANASIIYAAGFGCLLDNNLKLKLFLEMRLCENPLVSLSKKVSCCFITGIWKRKKQVVLTASTAIAPLQAVYKSINRTRSEIFPCTVSFQQLSNRCCFRGKTVRSCDRLEPHAADL